MKAYELVAKVKDLCLYSGTTRDYYILENLNMIQNDLYAMDIRWRALQARVDLYTTELLTLDTAPAVAWSVGDTITGATSETTSTVVDTLSTKTYNIKDRSDDYEEEEALSNGTNSATQGEDYPTVASNDYIILPSDVGVIYTIRQTSDSPYSKLEYRDPQTFHRLIPQPTQYAEGTPTYYTWFDGRLFLYPIPDATYTLRMYYYKRPTPMKIYATGTAALSSNTLTGTSTYWSNNDNVDVGMFFAYGADVRNDRTYAWTEIATITDNDTAILKETYAGSTSADGAYIMSSAPTFPKEFDNYLIYTAAAMEAMRNREMKESAGWLMQQSQRLLAGLITNNSIVPDETIVVEDFNSEPLLLGDDAAKFPFIKGNL